MAAQTQAAIVEKIQSIPTTGDIKAPAKKKREASSELAVTDSGKRFDSLMKAIAAASKSDHKNADTLRKLGQDTLRFVLDTNDVRPLNLLFGKGTDDRYTLTKAHRDLFVRFFRAHIGRLFEGNKDEHKAGADFRFTRANPSITEGGVVKIKEALRVSLKDAEFNPLDWNREAKPKAPKDAGHYQKQIGNLLKSAKDEGLDEWAILKAVMIEMNGGDTASTVILLNAVSSEISKGA